MQVFVDGLGGSICNVLAEPSWSLRDVREAGARNDLSDPFSVFKLVIQYHLHPFTIHPIHPYLNIFEFDPICNKERTR